jgi:nitrate/nitrite transport system ATP-binding protein
MSVVQILKKDEAVVEESDAVQRRDYHRAFLDLSGVSIEFPTRKGPFKALDNVNLKIDKGEYISIIDRAQYHRRPLPGQQWRCDS